MVLKNVPDHRFVAVDRWLALYLVSVVDHTLLVTALSRQAFISSDIDCGIWFTKLIQESVEISRVATHYIIEGLQVTPAALFQ